MIARAVVKDSNINSPAAEQVLKNWFAVLMIFDLINQSSRKSGGQRMTYTTTKK
jgi:hypothetical protein